MLPVLLAEAHTSFSVALPESEGPQSAYLLQDAFEDYGSDTAQAIGCGSWDSFLLSFCYILIIREAPVAGF